MEIKNSTGGHINGLAFDSGPDMQRADVLHFFGTCSKVTGSNIAVQSSDDSLSFTSENQEKSGIDRCAYGTHHANDLTLIQQIRVLTVAGNAPARGFSAVLVSLLIPTRTDADTIETRDVNYATSSGFDIGAVGVILILIAFYATWW
ncbi:hypothetical protein [uncultured Sphingomonas sp.]|uniref:hypothetical protein n=1 Tax=uncultured Sphingomonas sp. TaxID=158754 RepID=UPI0035CB1E28